MNKAIQYLISAGLGEFDYEVFELIEENGIRNEALY